MPNVQRWAGTKRALSVWNPIDRSWDTARTIDAAEISLVLIRATNVSGRVTDVLLPAQNVRADAYRHPREYADANGEISNSAVVIIGYKGHPTIPDTDIQRGDRFAYLGFNYTVLQFLPVVKFRIIAIADIKD